MPLVVGQAGSSSECYRAGLSAKAASTVGSGLCPFARAFEQPPVEAGKVVELVQAVWEIEPSHRLEVIDVGVTDPP